MTDLAPAVITRPMAHQVAAVSKLSPTRVGALLMEMGTGKSLCSIMLAVRRWEKISRVVWCCPVSLKRNTMRQILTHTSARPEDVNLFDAETTDANLPDADWHIVGLESIGQSSRVTLALNALVDDRTMLVVDESSYIKGHRSKRTRRLSLIGRRARYRLVLNGTPISQGIEDLYAQMAFLDQRILGYKSWYSFQRAHIRWSERYRGRIDHRVGSDDLSARMAPYIYQVTKSECLELPPKLPATNTYVPLTSAQKSLYKDAKLRFETDLMDLDSDDDAGIAVYRLFGALRAIASGVVPAGFTGHGNHVDCAKAPELQRLVRQLTDSHIVVWCQYRANITTAAAALDGLGVDVYRYCGDTGERERDQDLQRWRREGGVLVATAASGGYGLDLVEARHAIFYSNGFKYSERLQAEDRMHRIGQDHPVTYTNIWSECGIEDRIESALAAKGDALASLREAMRVARDKGSEAVASALRAL